MKFLIVTLGSLGDLMPFVLVADGLRARGHEIVFATHAGYQALIQAQGFDFHAIWDTPSGHGLDGLLQSDPAAFWRAIRRDLFDAATDRTFAFIEGVAAREKCSLLAPWSAFGAKRAHDELGIPLCTAYLSPHALSEPLAGPAAAGNLAFFPEWFGPQQPDWPALTHTGFPFPDDALLPALPPALEDFLQKGMPPVVFTPGSFQRQGETFFQESLAACAELNLRAIFLTPYAAQIPADLPPTVLHFKYVPLQRLLPRARAVVHHGGIGTCAQAMRAGVPQLIMPRFFDQPDNAARIKALGLGRVIGADGYDSDDTAQALKEIARSDPMKRDCARVAARLRQADMITRICEAVEKILRGADQTRQR